MPPQRTGPRDTAPGLRGRATGIGTINISLRPGKIPLSLLKRESGPAECPLRQGRGEMAVPRKPPVPQSGCKGTFFGGKHLLPAMKPSHYPENTARRKRATRTRRQQRPFAPRNLPPDFSEKHKPTDKSNVIGAGYTDKYRNASAIKRRFYSADSASNA